MVTIPRTASMPTTKEALSVYLRPEIKTALAAMAQEEDRSMAYVAAKAIEKMVLEWSGSKISDSSP